MVESWLVRGLGDLKADGIFEAIVALGLVARINLQWAGLGGVCRMLFEAIFQSQHRSADNAKFGDPVRPATATVLDRSGHR